MKKTPLLILSIFVLCLVATPIFAQSNTTSRTSFVIHGTNLNDTDLNFFTKSIEAVDLEKYRAKTTNVFLEFRNNFSLELISAEKLVQSGATLDLSKYSDILPSDYRYPIFKIDDSGILVIMHKTKVTKAELNESSK